MKAALLLEVGAPLSVEEVELHGPRSQEVRVRVMASGLCHSDYHVMTGDLPLPGTSLPVLLGHEAAGIVEAVGEDVVDLRPGDRVVTSYSSYCGECPDCQMGYNNRCAVRPPVPLRESGSRITWKGRPVLQAADIGGFAEEILIHRRAAVKIPEAVPFASAALLGCGVLTGAGAAINGAKVQPGSSVVVIGCGGVGLNTIQGARIAGAETIIAVDTSSTKIAMAREFGATAGVIAGPDAVNEVLERSKGGVDYAFEAVGLPSALRDGFSMLRKHGTLVVVGMPKTGAEMSFPVLDMMWKNLRIITSGMGDAPFQLFVPKLARFYLDGKLKLDELVSNKIGLDEINDAYQVMLGGKVARSVVSFE